VSHVLSESSEFRAEALPLHTRTLNIIVSRESAGLWRARGDVIDLRKTGCVPSVDDVQPAGIIHMMNIELDFDPATLRMDRIEVDQPYVAVEPSKATGGECCRDPVPRLEALTGDHLDEGFTRRLAGGFGGPLGCSHLLTLFQLMASTVPRAIALERERATREDSETAPGTRFFRRSIYVDGQTLRDGSLDVVIQLADTHTRPPSPGNRGFERLASSHEVKCFAGVERKRFRLERLDVRERTRDLLANANAPWIDHAALVAPLVGNPLIPGMAGRIFKLFETGAPKCPIQDSLLQLAPGFIQIMAALMDHNFRNRQSEALASEPASPSVAGIGGMPDSCYMWRTDSPYAVSRREAMLPRRSD
jgi:hypothetical protein